MDVPWRITCLIGWLAGQVDGRKDGKGQMDRRMRPTFKDLGTSTWSSPFHRWTIDSLILAPSPHILLIRPHYSPGLFLSPGSLLRQSSFTMP